MHSNERRFGQRRRDLDAAVSKPLRRDTIISWLLVICLIPFLTGCLTGRLWDRDLAVDHRQPAPDANLKLFQKPDGGDVLVQYDEERDRDDVVKRRAFYLQANQKKLSAGKRPHFVSARKADHMQPITLESSSATNSISPGLGAFRAALLPDGRHFTLICNGRVTGPYGLPVYVDRCSQVDRLALTPLAVTGDVVIAGAVAGLLYLYARAGSAGPIQ